MTKTLLVTAGFGRFSLASRRMICELEGCRGMLDCVCVDEDLLREIADCWQVDGHLFSERVKGFGHYAWKPLLIAHYSSYCDELIYLDAGCDVEADSFSWMIKQFRAQQDKDLILARAGHSVSDFTEPWVVQELAPGSQDVLGGIEMLQAGIVFLRSKSELKDIFLEAVHVLKTNPHCFSGCKSKCWHVDTTGCHRHDQSVINLLLLNHALNDRVGVFDSSFSPPDHLGYMFRGRPGLIAGRNVYGVSMYWPLNSRGMDAFRSPFNAYLIFVKVAHFLLKVCGGRRWMVSGINSLARLFGRWLFPPDFAETVEARWPRLLHFPVLVKQSNRLV